MSLQQTNWLGQHVLRAVDSCIVREAPLVHLVWQLLVEEGLGESDVLALEDVEPVYAVVDTGGQV